MNRTTTSFKTSNTNYSKAVPKENYFDQDSVLAAS